MTEIILKTKIKAPAERCFLLSLSVELHTGSTAKTQEKAVAGVTKGLMKLNDTVTWEARHFGVVQRFTSRISAYHKPDYFVSEMQKGAFKKFYHRHFFMQAGGYCIMKDELELESPFGILGRIADTLVLKHYIRKFLIERNQFIKRCAESEEWKNYLS